MGIKYKVNSSFFKDWNSVMAYCLGFIYADGSIYRSSRGHYIAITSTDKPIILNFKQWLGSDHVITMAKPTWPNGNPRFTLRIGDKEIYYDLVKLGLYPNKSLTIRMPQIPDFFIGDFIRGYFDGDGCVYLYKSKGKKQKLILRQLSAVFTSGSKLFLMDLMWILREKSVIRQKRVYDSHRSFQLKLGTNDSVKLFKLMYKKVSSGAFFLRKYRTFFNYFKLRPQRIDKAVQGALRYLSNGHVAK